MMESDLNTPTKDGVEGDDVQEATDVWRQRMKSLNALDNFDQV